jgi:hypothetical protein
MRAPLRTLVLVTALLVLGMSAPAWADPLVVDGASLGGACSDARAPAGVSLTTPWCTIVQAVKAAPSGSTVFVRGGSYPYQLLHGLGSRSDYVTFEPYGYDSGNPETVTIAGISTANTGFLRFQGFHLVGDDSSGFVPAARIYLYSHDIQFVDNEMTGEGVFLQTAAHVLIQGNHIHDLKRNCNITQVGDGGGIFLIGANSGAYPSVDIRVLANRVDRSLQDSLNLGSISNLVVDRNDFSTGTAQCGDHTDLVQIEGGAMGPITITDNLFHDGGQFILRNATGLVIQNNLILRVNQWMQLMADPGARVISNTWYGGNTYCTGCGSLIIRDYAAGSSWTQPPFNYKNHMTGTVIENNIMRLFSNNWVPAADYHEDYDLIYGTQQNSTGVQGAHTMFAQPSFVDTAGGDYHLLSGSRGIDSADSAVAPVLDMSGNAASDDPSVADTGAGPVTYRDIGALETQFLLPPLPVPTDGYSTLLLLRRVMSRPVSLP